MTKGDGITPTALDCKADRGIDYFLRNLRNAAIWAA